MNDEIIIICVQGNHHDGWLNGHIVVPQYTRLGLVSVRRQRDDFKLLLCGSLHHIMTLELTAVAILVMFSEGVEKYLIS